jgi:hypothetical protein
MTNARTSEFLTPREAAKLVPRRYKGKPCHKTTILRWCKVGLRGITLKHVVIGQTPFTTRRWLEGFWAEVTAARAATRQAPPGAPGQADEQKTPGPLVRTARRERELEQVKKALAERLGR